MSGCAGGRRAGAPIRLESADRIGCWSAAGIVGTIAARLQAAAAEADAEAEADTGDMGLAMRHSLQTALPRYG